MDDIGIAANDADHLIANLRTTFKRIQEAGFKLTMDKCHFGETEIDFLGRTIAPQGVTTPKSKTYKLSSKDQTSEVEKDFATLFRVRNYVPRLSEHLTPFYRMLKSDEKVLVSKELAQQFEELKKALDKFCDLALQQPLPSKQIALMTDSSFAAAGYAILIEDDPNQKST